MHAASRKQGWVLSSMLILLLLSFPLPAAADGGAPNLAYVAGTLPGVGVIDVARQQITRTISVPGDPHVILLSQDGRLLYVTQPTLGRVAVLAARTGQVICTAHLSGTPTLLALRLDAATLYAAGPGGTNVTALDPATCAVQGVFDTGAPVYGLAVAPVESSTGLHSQLWVAGTTSLTIFDEQGHLLDRVPITGGPQALCIPSELTAYVTTRRGEVVAVDVTTHQVLPALLTGGQFGLMDYDTVTGEVYIPDEQHNALDVLTPVIVGTILTPQEPEQVIRLSGVPEAVAITSDGQLGFVALRGGTVAMLDLPARRVARTFAVGGTPHFIITGLYPPAGALPPPQASMASPLNITALVVFALLIAALLGILWLVRRRHRKRFAAR
jgi:DNA-binding beta-propeller fold protein YncE